MTFTNIYILSILVLLNWSVFSALQDSGRVQSGVRNCEELTRNSLVWNCATHRLLCWKLKKISPFRTFIYGSLCYSVVCILVLYDLMIKICIFIQPFLDGIFPIQCFLCHGGKKRFISWYLHGMQLKEENLLTLICTHNNGPMSCLKEPMTYSHFLSNRSISQYYHMLESQLFSFL